MNEYPKISIITTVKNGEKYLEQTILSVINQSYPNIEYIVVDGGSTDNTISIIKKYENKIDYWVSENDKGIYNGMNKGINKSTGDYFAILNSDDYYVHNNVISEVCKTIIKTKANVLHGNALLIKTNGEIKPINRSNRSFLFTNPVIHPTLFVNSELFIKYGGFNEKYKIASDLDFVIKLNNNKYAFHKINKELVYIREGGYSFQNSLKRKEGLNIRLDNYKNWSQLIIIVMGYLTRELKVFVKKLIR